ncbi:MAG: PAS domain S-box protein [Gemmatimonadetes bacterium]|nr:PAS domain S-box protein [Gemmatimonadota bacterium]
MATTTSRRPEEKTERGLLRVLLVEDEPDDAELIIRELRRAGLGFRWIRVDTRPDYLEALRDPPDVVLSDHTLPQFSAIEALRLLRQQGSDIPFILVTGTQSEQVAAQCLKEGADDYLLKGNLHRLPAAIANAVRRREAEHARMRAEQERRQTAERYRVISEVASDFAYAARVEPDGKISLEWVTDAFTRVTGYSSGDSLGGFTGRLLPIHPDDYAAARAHIERLLAGHPDAREFRILTRSGDARWLAVRARPVWDGARLRVTRIYGAARDITERQRAEVALHRTADLLQAIVNSSPFAIVAYDLDNRIQMWNAAAERMFGWTASEVLGSEPPHRVPAEGVEFRELRRRVLAGESVRDVEARRHKRDDGELDVTISADPLRDASGKLIGWVNLLTDITERKRAREQLEEQRHDLAEAQELAHVGSWVWDIKTGVARWSAELARIHGLEPRETETVREAVLERIHPDDRARVAELIDTALRDKAGFAFQYRIVRPDGTERILQTRGEVVVDSAGQPIRMRGAAQDITEQSQALQAVEAGREELRQLARRLQQIREEERARISREIHDELGQCLTGLKMDLAWVGTKLKPGQEPLRERNDAMIGLVDSTIDTVRRIAAELRPGLLDDLGLQAAMEWQANEFTRRAGVDVTLELEAGDGSLPPEVSTAIFRIFQEALTNVARHASAHHVTARLARDEGALLLSVHDDGRGLSEADRPGRRSLGILGMRERARALGGDVTVNGAPDQGTTVTARIPVSSYL